MVDPERFVNVSEETLSLVEKHDMDVSEVIRSYLSFLSQKHQSVQPFVLPHPQQMKQYSDNPTQDDLL